MSPLGGLDEAGQGHCSIQLAGIQLLKNLIKSCSTKMADSDHRSFRMYLATWLSKARRQDQSVGCQSYPEENHERCRRDIDTGSNGPMEAQKKGLLIIKVYNVHRLLLD